MMTIKDKIAFVTGGATGTGRAITEAFLARGAKVLFCDSDDTMGTMADKELTKKYGASHVLYVHCKVPDATHFKTAFEKAIAMWGRVDIMVNKAEIFSETDMEKTMAVNVLALMHGTMMAEKHMRKDNGGKGGVIINMASFAGLYASTGDFPNYIASKHAVIGFTASMALCQKECGHTGVRLCCVCPGPVDTEMVRDMLELMKPEIRPLMDQPCSPTVIGEAVIKACEDTDNHGGLLEVWSRDRCSYRRRLVVGKDGVSNPIWSDEPLRPQVPPLRGKKGAVTAYPTTTTADPAATMHSTMR